MEIRRRHSYRSILQVAILNISVVPGQIIPSMLVDYLSTYNIRVLYVLSCRIFMTSIEKVSGMIVLAILYKFMSGTSMFKFHEKMSRLTVIKVFALNTPVFIVLSRDLDKVG